MIFAVMIFSLFLFSGSVFIMSLSNGAVSMASRLGADIMIVPAGFDPHIDNILLTGKPSAFYLPDNALEELNALNLQAIDKVTPQVFMATLRASCCAYPVQIMGIDYESDFIVRTWLDRTLNRPLNDDEIILGYHSTGEIGDEIIFFDVPLKIAGRLERTGMGFDSSVFMNRKTIIKLANTADKIKSQKLAQNNNLISVIMIKLKPGYDTSEISRSINKALNDKGMYALFSKRFVSNISSSLVLISRIVKYFLVMLWIMAVIIIALLFSLTVNERKKEFGILRSIGATRKRLAMMIMNEALIISLCGSITGLIFGVIIIFSVSPFISEMIHLPFLLPAVHELTLTAVMSCLIAILTGIISSAFFAFKAGYNDIHENIKT